MVDWTVRPNKNAMRMKRIFSLLIAIIAILCFTPKGQAQITEPKFIGEAVMVLPDSTSKKLDKEFAQFRSGISWSTNAWDALYLKIESGKAALRLPKGSQPIIIVKAADNNSDPMSIINVYKFKAKKNKRETMIARSNEGTTGSSYNVTKNLIPFSGDKYGDSSYIIELPQLEPGEYGIIVTNPNSLDQKRAVVSCFAIDK